ncbi:hypothetical protein INO04_14690, partial [Staphylococcus aureus]|nr:hypothetical protein [Staphylococcus aureus]MBO8500550.1 hypothetical protein [Staphylococcus aureus]
MPSAVISDTLGCKINFTPSKAPSNVKDLITMTIKSSAISIVVMNIFVSVLAGLAIFPALHSFGYEPQEGPGL